MPRHVLLFLCCFWFAIGNNELAGQEQRKPPDARDKPPAQSDVCKSATHWGVKGCEPLPDGSCPKGYTKQPACPSNPQMKAPCWLMCVPTQKKHQSGNADQKPKA
jgi:hypothetical protein